MFKWVKERKLKKDIINLRSDIQKTNQINIRGICQLLTPLVEKYSSFKESSTYAKLKEYNESVCSAIREGRDNRFDNQYGAVQSIDRILG